MNEKQVKIKTSINKKCSESIAILEQIQQLTEPNDMLKSASGLTYSKLLTEIINLGDAIYESEEQCHTQS